MDEILDAGAADTGSVDTTHTDTQTTDSGAADTGLADATLNEGSQADGAAAPDEFAAFEKLFGKDDETVAAVDGKDAADPAALPEEVSRALGVSEFIKEPAQLEVAVRAADEVFQVQSGSLPAHAMLEGIRGRDPQRFESIIKDSLIPYIEHVTGQKFGGAAAAEAPDPVAEMRQKIAELEQRPLIEAQQREQQQQRQAADMSTRTEVEKLIKGGTGIFDGATDDALNGMAAQMAKAGIKPDVLMKEVLSGKTDRLETLYKAAEKAEMARVRAMSQRLIARSKTLKNAVPPSKGSGGGAVTSIADGKHDLTTQAGRTAAMVAAWNQGSDTV